MTCNECMHHADCENLAFHNFDHSHKMWLIEFWGNAEERCQDFEPVGENGA